MPSLLEAWPKLAGRIGRASSIALFLDFDGTLAPLVARPEDAAAGRLARAALARLGKIRRVRVWIISGRAHADLRERLHVPGLGYLGILGWDSGSARLDNETRKILDRTRRELIRRLDGTPGLHVENKGVTFALHYRGAPYESVRIGAAAIEEVLSPASGILRAEPGEQVWEVLPRQVRGKGFETRRRWRGFGGSALPIYIGNDRTDEPAFAALSEGITARVGRQGVSRARYFLRNPGEVGQFLDKLCREVAWTNGVALPNFL